MKIPVSPYRSRRRFVSFAVSLLAATALVGCGQSSGADADAVDAPTTTPTPIPVERAEDHLLFNPPSQIEGSGVGAGDPFSISLPNSAGGVDFQAGVGVLKSSVNYLTFTAVPYNAVDDPVTSSISNESARRLKATGPFEIAAFTPVHFENVWYNPTIKYAMVTDVTIEYDSGEIVDVQLDEPIRADVQCRQYTHESHCREF